MITKGHAITFVIVLVAVVVAVVVAIPQFNKIKAKV